MLNFFFFLMFVLSMSCPINHCQIQYHKDFPYIFSFKCFLSFNPYIYLGVDPVWVNFCIRYKVRFQLYCLHVDIYFSLHHLLKRCFSPLLNILASLSKVIWPCMQGFRASQVPQWVKNPPAMLETEEMWIWSLGQKDPLEEGMATLSSILAWRIPWTEETGRPQSIGLQWVEHMHSRIYFWALCSFPLFHMSAFMPVQNTLVTVAL